MGRAMFAEAGGLPIGVCQDLQNAGHRGGGGRIDTENFGMGVRRADEGAPRHTRQGDVVNIVAGTAQETVVFTSFQRLSHIAHDGPLKSIFIRPVQYGTRKPPYAIDSAKPRAAY